MLSFHLSAGANGTLRGTCALGHPQSHPDNLNNCATSRALCPLKRVAIIHTRLRPAIALAGAVPRFRLALRVSWLLQPMCMRLAKRTLFAILTYLLPMFTSRFTALLANKCSWIQDVPLPARVSHTVKTMLT